MDENTDSNSSLFLYKTLFPKKTHRDAGRILKIIPIPLLHDNVTKTVNETEPDRFGCFPEDRLG